MKSIQMIDIGLLEPHPQNPRKQIGDVAELADSIRAVGIMQNLTVVPFEDKYRILIGHRRCAAAKEAGLTRLPCAIVNIPEKDQVEIMLVENMQRSDLTVLEEAQGLQLMVEMGNSIRDICEKTGFSESKVRHRVKMGELDQKVLQKKFEECQNISIMDLQKLEKIKDQKRKDKVLKMIGTSNFEMALKKAVEEEKHDEWETELFSLLPDDIERIDDSKDKTWLCSFRDWTSNEISFKKLGETDEKKYWRRGYSSIEIYIDTTEEEIKKRDREKEKRRELAERKKALEDVIKRMCELRIEFLKKLSNRDCGYFLFHEPKMQRMVLSALAVGSMQEADLLDLLDINLEYEPEPWETEEWEEIIDDSVDEKNIKKALLLGLYLTMDPQKYDKIYDIYGRFQKNEKYREVYKFMDIIGYEVSDEERQILDGTHELYVKEEENV